MPGAETEFELVKRLAGELSRVPVPRSMFKRGSEIGSSITTNVFDRLPERVIFRARERYEMAVMATAILKEWRPPLEYKIAKWPPDEIDDLPKWLYANYILMGKDVLAVLRSVPGEERHRVKFAGYDIDPSILPLLKDKRQGMVVSMIHGADYVLSPFVRDLFGQERIIHAFAEVQPPPLGPLIEKKLKDCRINPIWVGDTIDEEALGKAMRGLRKGEIINTHPDRPPTGDLSLIELDFFGHKAIFPRSSTIGLGRLAPTIPGFACRTYWGYEGFSGRVIPKMEKETQDYLVQQLVKEYERLIAQHLIRDGVRRASSYSFMSPIFVE